MRKNKHSDNPEEQVDFRWAAYKGKKFIFESKDEPLSVSSVYAALMEIKESKSRRLLPLSRRPFPDQLLTYENFETVDLPSEDAIRVITRALRDGERGKKLLKAALELKIPARGKILARYIARKLMIPKGGWPDEDNEEAFDNFDSSKVEWVKPTKQQVERELENQYPEIYKALSTKDGKGGKLLRSDFWDDAGLKNVLDQTRGNG